MIQFLEAINAAVWGIPLLALIMGCGIYLSIVTGFVQIRCFSRAIHHFIKQLTGKKQTGQVSGYKALCTALSATVGTGNIAGVAGAIALGGPGSVFWMWIFGLLGMAIKFAEATLAVSLRERNKDGTYKGGPMYMIRQSMGKSWQWLGLVYAFFGVVAAFGVGNATQINTVISGVNAVITSAGGQESTLRNFLIGAALAALIWFALCGGINRISSITEKLIPFACVGYILMCIFALFLCRDRLIDVLRIIVIGAFSPKAVTFGALGSGLIALRVGASRGLFTNEAGMGTAAIAHASAQVTEPVEQGFLGIVEVFLDTIIICTLTALVILSSGISIEYGADTGILLTVQAFSSLFGTWIRVPIMIFLCLFAIATVFGWGLYGTVCAEYLFGSHSIRLFICMQVIMVMISSVLKTQMVWILAETVNGLMAIPNLIVLFVLSPRIIRELKAYNEPLRDYPKGKAYLSKAKICAPSELS